MKLTKIKKLVDKALGFIPTKLPVGITEFDNWYSKIITTYDLPDNDSVKFSMAVMVLHLGETDAYKANHYFYLKVLKAMSNQVVSQVINDLKEKQKAEQAAAAEATAKQVASDEPVQNQTIQ